MTARGWRRARQLTQAVALLLFIALFVATWQGRWPLGAAFFPTWIHCWCWRRLWPDAPWCTVPCWRWRP